MNPRTLEGLDVLANTSLLVAWVEEPTFMRRVWASLAICAALVLVAAIRRLT